MSSSVASDTRFACDARQVARARRLAGAMAREHGWHGRDVERVQLAVSELATNAVRHAKTPFTLHCEVDRHAHIEVRDEAPDAQVRWLLPDPDRIGGRGLEVVRALSSSWGVEQQDDSKRVWCVIEPTSSEASTSYADR